MSKPHQYLSPLPTLLPRGPLLASAITLACGVDPGGQSLESFGSGVEAGSPESDGPGSATGDETPVDGTDTGPLLDLPDDDPCVEGEDCECSIPEHQPCDDDPEDLFAAMGLGCAGELEILPSTTGNPVGMGTRQSFGSTDAFAPREGERYVVLGSGKVANLDMVPGPDAAAGEPCSSDFDADLGNTYDPGTLPIPMLAQNVGDEDCYDDPNLVGMGDCSNTIADQLDVGDLVVQDYAEMRFTVTVPEDVFALSFDLAFFSDEYPYYYGSQYNDMFIGWLESELWTGNISFDEMGNPISLNAGYLDYRDAKGTTVDPLCENGCDAPELHGTCMEGHAGTKWLTTSIEVTPGETLTMVFAIFDQGDSALDSFVFLDNFQWGCTGTPPQTVPID